MYGSQYTCKCIQVVVGTKTEWLVEFTLTEWLVEFTFPFKHHES